jgi:hypothetical protein
VASATCPLPYPLPAPILFCKACESTLPPFFLSFPLLIPWLTCPKKVFIAEITARAFIVADSNKRRTLSRADIAKALSKSDQFDFLIDIVPRDEPFVPGVSGPGKNPKKPVPGAVSMRRDAVRACFRPKVDYSSLRPKSRRPHKMLRVRLREIPLSTVGRVLPWMACRTLAC